MLAITTAYDVVKTAIICCFLLGLGVLIIFGIYAGISAERGRGILPWGSRQRVEKERAAMEVAELRLQTEKAEIGYLALQPARQRVEKALHDGQRLDLKRLFEPDHPELGPGETKEGRKMRDDYFNHGT